MNRLILLGNGFDLAHGMKTSYNDFILWYLKKRINLVFQKEYEDSLLRIAPSLSSEPLPVLSPEFKFSDKATVSEIMDLLYEKNWLKSFLKNEKVLNLKSNLRVELKSTFLGKLLGNFGPLNWVDVENEYYHTLKEILQQKDELRQKSINRLNNSFEQIIRELSEYLESIQPPDESSLIVKFDEIINNRIEFDEIPILKDSKKGHREYPEKLYVLNFNYTSTVERNTFSESDEPLRINYIHGKLNDKENPIIFGFGDEYDDAYKLIEREKTKGFFKFIKSFGYFQNSNYQDLIRYIESGDFQVYVLGHSCGLSDRTMLKMIFEHEYCKSIKIYYHKKDNGTDNFTEITEEISRHFDDKGLMRKKIVPKDKSKPIPQIKSQ